MKNKVKYIVQRAIKPIKGIIIVPGDKSISHRALMFGSLATGLTKITGFLDGYDSLSTLQSFREMGVEIYGPKQNILCISGAGIYGLKNPKKNIYLGNSGTSMRLLTGLLAGQKFDTKLTGDLSLNKRPMNRVEIPLRLMGAKIKTDKYGVPPVKILGNRLTGINYIMPIASAQVKSCLLLAGIYAKGETKIIEPGCTRDHTERMLKSFGYKIKQKENTISLVGGSKLKASKIKIPADISSAAFFLVAASIIPNSDLLLKKVGINPTRIGVINILRKMGADINLLNEKIYCNEPVADINIKYAKLKGIDIPLNQVPLAIDELPILLVAAANAEGITRLRGASELRVKECDRISAMAKGFKTIGVKTSVYEDGIDIFGTKVYKGGCINSYGDHRIAMSFTIAALKATDVIVIDDCTNVSTSFPNFNLLLTTLGINIKEVKY
ncbi:3-phosphoshikimate 1-carboxyvinyltransferase [Candidatus Portiera aleyrodidarum MED (Bemisia tabaci)]|uniref:3-phosphoshikimate 1-carboxyvinyltransferase n=1 Tax=Candidatus Portiera aleyrodidarum MED (Bemisia tabaci) TaxID=1163752 RepID=A0AAU8RYI1_9GAMM|nr:3-phosphoshikimate 1-carboxyvinyltransferase [Candidatus Portiera aleyrodidarum]AFS18875.1 3-phosphoshikimate 1-carboxyvinyltransferase [Candidatus Portiera aleyrodidarum BT-QVLC]AFT80508.1 5-Enolpyruvylshikimate-3-phosphate synthase [Candidatus Portiera aleyrodidarum BT-QVLC]AJF24088.1 3-phosphoshikimate 1-carboxyvinyltransferase [Candidatus Portiera aleyrodidarum MED (Bemisia tabaci)]